MVVVLTLHWINSSRHHHQSHPVQYHLLSHSTLKVRMSNHSHLSDAIHLDSESTPLLLDMGHPPTLAQHHINSTALRNNILHILRQSVKQFFFLFAFVAFRALIRPLVPFQLFHFNPASHTDSTTTRPQIPLDQLLIGVASRFKVRILPTIRSASDWIPR